MTDKEAMKMALEALEKLWLLGDQAGTIAKPTITALKERLAQPEQEPVAWLLTDKNINSLQVDSIQRLIDRLKHAHHTDIHVRINGHDEWFEADWLKHLTRTTPPQREWVGLTDEEHYTLADKAGCMSADWVEFAKSIEQALKEKNT